MAETKERIILAVTSRDMFGKQVKKIRKQGKIPSNIFGKDFESKAIAVDYKEFEKVYKKTGETQVIYVVIEGDKKEIPCLVSDIQFHPVSEAILHVDLRKVNLKQKIEANVPIKLVGESPAVKLGGDMYTEHDSILIEALPNNIPAEIAIDISILTEIGSHITIGDIKTPSDVEIKDNPETIVVSVIAHQEQSDIPDISTELPEAAYSEEGSEPTEESSKKG